MTIKENINCIISLSVSDVMNKSFQTCIADKEVTLVDIGDALLAIRKMGNDILEVINDSEADNDCRAFIPPFNINKVEFRNRRGSEYRITDSYNRLYCITDSKIAATTISKGLDKTWEKPISKEKKLFCDGIGYDAITRELCYIVKDPDGVEHVVVFGKLSDAKDSFDIGRYIVNHVRSKLKQ